jgi:hypothetical protein
LQSLGFVGINVTHLHGHALGQQPARHATPHIAHTDDGDGGPDLGHDCTNCLERAIDIKIPTPSPRVTMAVPP